LETFLLLIQEAYRKVRAIYFFPGLRFQWPESETSP